MKKEELLDDHGSHKTSYWPQLEVYAVIYRLSLFRLDLHRGDSTGAP